MGAKTRTLYDPGALKSLSIRPLHVTVTEGPDSGQTHELKKRTIIVGSDPDLPVSLNDETVSYRHARFEQTEQGLSVQDLGSTNGIMLNDIRIEKGIIPLPAELHIGNSVLRIETENTPFEVNVYESDHLAGLVGQSPAMEELFGMIARVAPSDATTLISGESGTGKELVARAIHDLSKRASSPFVVFDCSAVPSELIESELFGHIKGSFTGASDSRKGAFKEASGGTLFLDEIGELATELQPKLLRVLESREVKAVGSEKREQVDVRIVAATHRPLRHMVDEGSFRQDLYYRLAHIELLIPPLRERSDDIPLLIEHFLEQLETDQKPEVSFETMNKLMKHQWSGNVRELKNYVDRAALLSGDGKMETRFLMPQTSAAKSTQESDSPTSSGTSPLSIDFNLPFKDAKNQLVESFERTYWLRMLRANRWNISAAAREAGIHRKSLEYVVRKLDLKEIEASD